MPRGFAAGIAGVPPKAGSNPRGLPSPQQDRDVADQRDHSPEDATQAHCDLFLLSYAR